MDTLELEDRETAIQAIAEGLSMLLNGMSVDGVKVTEIWRFRLFAEVRDETKKTQSKSPARPDVH